MAITTTSTIDDAVKKFLAESRFTLQERPGVVKSSIQVETLPEGEGPSIKLPKFNTVTTYALTEGIDMSQVQTISDTVMTLTPTEFGAQVMLTDLMLMESRDEFFRVAGRILAESYDRQQDQTLCDDLDNFSVAIGSAGTALNIGHVMAGHASIKYGNPAAAAGRGGEPGPDPVSGIFTPAQIHSLKKTMSISLGWPSHYQFVEGTTGVPRPYLERPEAAAYSEQFEAGGVMVKSDININKDASDDAKGGIISKMSMILAQLGEEPTVEKERDASLRAWELNFVGRWARGEYNDSWGIEALFDSVTPTS